MLSYAMLSRLGTSLSLEIKELKRSLAVMPNPQDTAVPMGLDGLLGRAVLADDLKDHKAANKIWIYLNKNSGHVISSGFTVSDGIMGLCFLKNKLSPSLIENWFRIGIEQCNNYDLTSGLVGMGHALLQQKSELKPQIFQELQGRISSRLTEFSENSKDDFLIGSSPSTIIDLGIAHGQAGYLEYLSTLYIHTLSSKVAIKAKAYRIVEHLFHLQQQLSHFYQWPSQIELDQRGNIIARHGFHRQAWCYGSLGIALAIWRTGIIFKDETLKDWAWNLFYESSRQNPKDLAIDNPFLCHGAAGIACVSNFFWQQTGEVAAKKQWERWLEISLKMSLKKISKKKTHGVISGRYGLLLAWNMYLHSPIQSPLLSFMRMQ